MVNYNDKKKILITGEHTMVLLFDTKIDCSIIVMAKIAEKLWEWTIYINKPKCDYENCIKFWQSRMSNEQKIKTN